MDTIFKVKIEKVKSKTRKLERELDVTLNFLKFNNIEIDQEKFNQLKGALEKVRRLNEELSDTFEGVT